MDKAELIALLNDFRDGERKLDEVVERLSRPPLVKLGESACLDLQRGLRAGLGEVVFAQGKEVEELEIILGALTASEKNILVTRVTPDKAVLLQRRFPDFNYHSRGRYLVRIAAPRREQGRGEVLIVTAGTSDLGVAHEAAVTLELMGQKSSILADVGVAGIHRLLAAIECLRQAEVLIVIAGMEGALPSVVAGLVEKPVIAVPTSVGYGASFGGIAALLGMLNSCAGGVGVVNIDNGFGAGYLAGLINRRTTG